MTTGNGNRVKKLQNRINLVHEGLKKEQKRSLAHVSEYSKRQRLARILFEPFGSLSEIQIDSLLDSWMHVEERTCYEVLTVLAALIALDRANKAAEILDAIDTRVRGETVTTRGYPEPKTVWWAHVIVDRIAPFARASRSLCQEITTLERYIGLLLTECAS